ncbi:MAG: hypothetical protein WEB58_10405 [Planctomycetaceae bacterium]
MPGLLAWIDRGLSIDEFRRRLQQPDGEWLFISSPRLNSAVRLEDIEKEFAGRDSAIVALLSESSIRSERHFPETKPNEQRVPLHRLPGWLRLFASPAEWDAVVVHRDVVKRMRRPMNGPEPVEEWLLHAVLSGVAVETIELDDLDNNDRHDGDEPAKVAHWRKPELLPGSPSRSWMRILLAEFRPETFSRGVRSSVDLTALRAGIFQVHDFLDESHELSQSIEGAGTHRHGDYWHAIMHRREPDYPNAKYWFRHVGRHPIFAELSQVVTRRVKQLQAKTDRRDENLRARLSQLVDGRGEWDPFAFVDFCRVCAEGPRADWTAVAEELQWAEMVLLLKATFDDALIVE